MITCSRSQSPRESSGNKIMKLILDDKEVPKGNDLLEKLITNDKALIRRSGSGNYEGRPKETNELTRELAALDHVMGNGTQAEIAKVHGISQEAISSYSNGRVGARVDDDLKARVNQVRYDIADLATSKIMTTLELFAPHSLEQKELPGAAMKMASVLEKISGKNKDEGNQQVHLHFYAPTQKKEHEYKIIEVG